MSSYSKGSTSKMSSSSFGGKNSKIEEAFTDFDGKASPKFKDGDKNSKYDEAIQYTGFDGQSMPKFEDGDKEMGICVRSDEFKGHLYSIVLHREYGEFVIRDVKINQGTWLLFTPTDEVFFIECQNKKLATNDYEHIQSRRRCSPIHGWTRPRTFKVEAFVNKIECRFNDQFNLCMDAILGKVLVSRFDGFINKKLRAGEEIALAVAHFPNFATGIHWVAIGVYASVMVQINKYQPKYEEYYYRQVKELPRNVKIIADLSGYPDEDKDKVVEKK